MDNSKKILILYASAGHGHEKAAKALKEVFLLENSALQVECVDTISLASAFFGNLYRQTYLIQIKYIPWMWGVFYYSFDMPAVYFFMKHIRRALNSLTAKKLEKLLCGKNPDVVLATHFTGIEVASFLKKQGKIRSRIVSVVTDYLPHRVWTADGVDAYMVAIQETKDGLIRRGVAAEKINITGIPIERKFLKTYSREAVAAKLGLDKNKFTVLVTSGGAGIGAMKLIVEGLVALKKPLQIISVCGTNKALFEDLERLSKANPLLKVLGFVNNMEELMDVSDIVIGKGGGLTITESFSKGKPVLLFQSIPGQEKRNVFCVEKYHAGYASDRPLEIVKKAAVLSEDPAQIERMRQGLVRMTHPDAAKNIMTHLKESFLG